MERHYINERGNESGENQNDYVSRSVNLLNKIKLANELMSEKEEDKRTFTNLQAKRKPKLDTNRKTPQ